MSHELMHFEIRIDWQSSFIGRQGGLPFQETEWINFSANSWEDAKVMGLALFKNRLPNDPLSPHFVQGGLILNKDRHDRRVIRLVVHNIS